MLFQAHVWTCTGVLQKAYRFFYHYLGDLWCVNVLVTVFGCKWWVRRRESQQCFSVHVGTCLTLFVWVCVCHLVSFKRDTTTCSMSSKKDDYKTAASMVIFSIFFYCWERDVYWALKVSDGNSHTAILLPITPSFTEHRTHLMDNLIVCPMVINVAAFLRTLISLH